jgi:Ca2+/Na+ antiporter
VTGLFWLFLSYGFVLYKASDLISEGSELLLLVPSMAGLVGGVVLPLLGAVPDGAIILFSGLGDIEAAQETLSVGVGALAGSTIMLLTVPFALSVYGGRVDLIGPKHDKPNYLGKPKLVSPKEHWLYEFTRTGVGLQEAVHHGGVLMVVTLLPYLLIQVPALFLHGPTQEVAKGEHWWSFLGLVICLLGLTLYMKLQLQISKDGENRDKRMAVVKKVLQKGSMSLSGAIAESVRDQELRIASIASQAATEYQSINSPHSTTAAPGGGGSFADTEGHPMLYPSPAVVAYLKEVLSDAFLTYDYNGDGELDMRETCVFFRDFHETISDDEMEVLFRKYDTDQSGFISFDEFIGLAYTLIKTQDKKKRNGSSNNTPAANDAHSNRSVVAQTNEAIAETAFADIEQEEVPEEFTDLSPEEQQSAIKLRAFYMCATGAVLVVFFSDPMVDVMQEIAVRAHVSPFYVSFVLAPLASNASEVISSMYYASKKTGKTITVSLSTLEGAACMNNTFCLSIFMGLIFFRGLAWQYTAETVAIIISEVVVAMFVQSNYLSLYGGCLIFMLFPLSIALVATLEAMGFD